MTWNYLNISNGIDPRLEYSMTRSFGLNGSIWEDVRPAIVVRQLRSAS